jgi:hypothetical protein
MLNLDNKIKKVTLFSKNTLVVKGWFMEEAYL